MSESFRTSSVKDDIHDDTNDTRPDLASLGLAVIDEIRFHDGKIVKDVLGGSGSFCTAGARLFSNKSTSRSIAWRIHAGDDFPDVIEQRLRAWEIDVSIYRSQGEASTRGLLVYADKGLNSKTFKYTTPVHQVKPRDLRGTRMLQSKCFHLLASPADAQVQVTELRKLISSSNIAQNQKSPLIIWEPAPLSCSPENLTSCLEAAKLVDVFSPNHLELQAFFGLSNRPFNKMDIESLAFTCLGSGVGTANDGIVLVRAGEHGSLAMSKDLKPVWQEPFYRYDDPNDRAKIVDTTGAGNAFLGGFGIGYLRTRDMLEASRYGAVAASFMLEQTGLPTLEYDNSSGKEVWNGDCPLARFEQLKSRTGVNSSSSCSAGDHDSAALPKVSLGLRVPCSNVMKCELSYSIGLYCRLGAKP